MNPDPGEADVEHAVIDINPLPDLEAPAEPAAVQIDPYPDPDEAPVEPAAIEDNPHAELEALVEPGAIQDEALQQSNSHPGRVQAFYNGLILYMQRVVEAGSNSEITRMSVSGFNYIIASVRGIFGYQHVGSEASDNDGNEPVVQENNLNGDEVDPNAVDNEESVQLRMRHPSAEDRDDSRRYNILDIWREAEVHLCQESSKTFGFSALTLFFVIMLILVPMLIKMDGKAGEISKALACILAIHLVMLLLESYSYFKQSKEFSKEEIPSSYFLKMIYASVFEYIKNIVKSTRPKLCFVCKDVLYYGILRLCGRSEIYHLSSRDGPIEVSPDGFAWLAVEAIKLRKMCLFNLYSSVLSLLLGIITILVKTQMSDSDTDVDMILDFFWIYSIVSCLYLAVSSFDYFLQSAELANVDMSDKFSERFGRFLKFIVVHLRWFCQQILSYFQRRIRCGCCLDV